MLKGKGPEAFGGASLEQVESFIDGAASMDAVTLRRIMQLFKYLFTWAKPLNEVYLVLDKYTFGCAKYIVVGLIMMIVYYLGLVLFTFGYWICAKLFGWQLKTTASSVVSPFAKVSSAGNVIKEATMASLSTNIPKAVQAAGHVASGGLAAAAVGDVILENMEAVAQGTESISSRNVETKQVEVGVTGDAADAEFNF